MRSFRGQPKITSEARERLQNEWADFNTLIRQIGELLRDYTWYERETLREIDTLIGAIPEQAEQATQILYDVGIVPTPLVAELKMLRKDAKTWRNAIHEALKKFSDKDLNSPHIHQQLGRKVEEIWNAIREYEDHLRMHMIDFDIQLEQAWKGWRPDS